MLNRENLKASQFLADYSRTAAEFVYSVDLHVQGHSDITLLTSYSEYIRLTNSA
jgi:hypothetical protein